jgi:4-amino-4-deoxy-L-arabinose transferase-like glycosyltransferase
MASAISRWIRALPERHGRTTLILLALIVLLGLGLRAYRVVEPLGTPGDDARAYYALSKALYEEGRYGGPEFRDSSDWSPGAPLIYAASFYVTGGAREGVGRLVEALLGVAAIVVVFLLGKRIACRPTGLIAAFGVAVYPPFIHSTGALMSEPPALLTLPAAVLAFLWAADKAAPPPLPLRAKASSTDRRSLLRSGTAWVWLVPGFLFGLTALIRPEYLLVGLAFVLLAAIRVGQGRGWRPGLAAAGLFTAALLLPIAPWMVRNAVVLDRVVPISTGSGKALYVGTFLPADGEYQRVKALLVRRYRDRELAPHSAALDRVDPTPLFDRVAARYPELPRDSALSKIGKQNFFHYFDEDPLGYLAMTARKVGRMWSSGVGEAMSSGAGRAIQLLIVALGLAGIAVLALRRRWWESIAMATPIVLVTAIGAIALAAPRRSELLMTLVFPLAAAALARAGAVISSSLQPVQGTGAPASASPSREPDPNPHL